MKRKLLDLVFLVAASLTMLWTIPSVSQVLKGSISGTVVDPQGAVVSGAQVKAIHTATGAVLITKSDSAGLFRFNLISVGTYKIEISEQGFKTSLQEGVVVSAGADAGLGQVHLSVGGTTETVEVTSAAPLIETSQAQVTNTFDGATLQTFAGIQESEGLDNLALFVPGVVSVRDNGFSNVNGGLGFSSNGIRGRNNDQEIDGQNNNDNSVGGPSLFVADPEFVGQYVLVTNNFGPEYGRNSGSVVNIISKSGSNAWHGSVYENENNSVLNSMTNFMHQFDTDAAGNPLTKPPRLNDEFGGFAIGGPMVKSKAFFFGGFNQEIISTKTIYASPDSAPTPAGLATLNSCYPGSQSLAAYNVVGPYSISGGNPFPTNTFTTTVTPTAALGLADCPGVQFGGITRVLPTPTHNFNFINKEDLQLGRDTVVGRYLFNRGNNFNLDLCDGITCAAAGYPTNAVALSQSALIGDTHSFGTRMVNETKVGFTRLNVDFGGNNIGNTVPTAANVGDAITRITFQSAATLPVGDASNFPQSRVVNTWQAQDNWSLVVGRHALKAGVNWTYQRSPSVFLPAIDGSFRFGVLDRSNDQNNLATAWGNFAANQPNAVSIAQGNPSLDFREYDTFIYGGDDWKIGKNLTLNLGLTWTYYGTPENLFNQISTANQTGSNPLWNPSLPLSITTFPQFSSPKNSFGPSVGFAYSPQWGGFLTGHGKTTIRGGYRMLYDPPFYNIFVNMSSSAPEVFLNSFTGNIANPLAGIPTVPTGPNVRAELAPQLQTGVFDPRVFAETGLTPNFGPDKVQSWSLGFEREVSKNSAFEARYVGNHGYNLFQSINANPFIGNLATDFPNLVPAGLTPCAASQLSGPGASVALGREFCNEGVLRERTNSGFSNYDGVQVEFRANNLFKQLTLRTSYTYSKTLDNVSEIFGTFGGGNTVAFAQNPLNQTGEYSFSGLNIPNQWTILFTEELPIFKEQHGLVGHLLGGWAFSGNYILASGQGYTPSQVFAASAFATPGVAGDYFDARFFNNFNAGIETARPFVGSLNAPASAVGIYAADACSLFAFSGGDPTCNPAIATQLISLNALNQSCGSSSPCNVVQANKNQVRFIVNSLTSESIFGTPFGNAARNTVTDAITNTVNFAVLKRIRFNEHNSFELRVTMLNAMNHQNFGANGTGIDPFIEDAGLVGPNTGFGNVGVTNTNAPGSNNSTRRITVGGTFRF